MHTKLQKLPRQQYHIINIEKLIHINAEKDRNNMIIYAQIRDFGMKK